jgi:hypothetical protein
MRTRIFTAIEGDAWLRGHAAALRASGVLDLARRRGVHLLFHHALQGATHRFGASCETSERDAAELLRTRGMLLQAYARSLMEDVPGEPS